MFCGRCGKELAEGSKFCGNCGNIVTIPNVSFSSSEEANNDNLGKKSTKKEKKVANRDKKPFPLRVKVVIVTIVIFLSIGYTISDYYSIQTRLLNYDAEIYIKSDGNIFNDYNVYQGIYEQDYVKLVTKENVIPVIVSGKGKIGYQKGKIKTKQSDPNDVFEYHDLKNSKYKVLLAYNKNDQKRLEDEVKCEFDELNRPIKQISSSEKKRDDGTKWWYQDEDYITYSDEDVKIHTLHKEKSNQPWYNIFTRESYSANTWYVLYESDSVAMNIADVETVISSDGLARCYVFYNKDGKIVSCNTSPLVESNYLSEADKMYGQKEIGFSKAYYFVEKYDYRKAMAAVKRKSIEREEAAQEVSTDN